MWNRCETNGKQMWNRCETDVKQMWNRWETDGKRKKWEIKYSIFIFNSRMFKPFLNLFWNKRGNYSLIRNGSHFSPVSTKNNNFSFRRIWYNICWENFVYKLGWAEPHLIFPQEFQWNMSAWCSWNVWPSGGCWDIQLLIIGVIFGWKSNHL